MIGKLFGKEKAKGPITLTPFAETNIVEREALTCDGWILKNVGSFEALVAELRQLQAAHPDHKLLTTLDDFGQAAYTSMHTIHADDLERVLRSEAPDAPESWFEGEDTGYAKGSAAFPYMLANIRKKAECWRLADLEDFLPFSDPDVPHNDPVAMNVHADAFLMLEREKEIIVQTVPVKRAAETIAAFPNGYFHPDLKSHQNLVLAEVMEERHGLGLFGIGSSALSFWREEPLDSDQAIAVSETITAIYHSVPDEAETLLARAITGKREVLLRYTES